MRKCHRYKIELQNGRVLKFKSKHHIQDMYLEMIDGTAFLIFEDVNTIINTEQVKKFEMDGVEYETATYYVY